jgi:serine/threonine protein kinase/tetratricopeptide (TPR) repeat protein
VTSDRSRRVRALFERLVDLEPEARAAALDAECAGDPALRRDLEELLAQDLPTAALRVAPVLDRLRPIEAEATIGPYRIERPLGEGGFGEVYVAEQTAPLRRRVALKILKAGMDTKSVLARFEAERQTLALMDHPNIAKVHDAGETPRGRPYFVMELVEGEPLTRFADHHALTIRARLDLFIAITHAVQHAHQKGVIHRDLKPSNVLVSMVDGKPVPKVIDFGIAKARSHALTERTLLTEAGQFMGTPEYMSPEQAEMGGLDVDTRTDVYSLGVMLYELLTGVLPFEAAALRKAPVERIQQIIRQEAPSRPSTRVTARGAAGTEAAAARATEPRELSRLLRGDLDWIVLRAMEKDRARRYESAGALAADIQRHLEDEPVLAGPPSVGYRTGKFAKRHRAAIGVAAIVLVSLLAGLYESNRQRIVAERARVEAERARDESDAVTTFLADMLEAADPRIKGKDVSVRAIIDSAATTIADKFPEQPLVRARLMQTMSGVYQGLGRYAEARPLIEGALSIREATLGPDHSDLAHSLNSLAILLRETGDAAGARPHYERALAVWEKSEGPEGPNVAQVLNNLANLHWQSGDHATARPLMERALAIREKVRGPEHPDVAQTLNNLGGLLCEMGDYDGSRACHERALVIRQKALGPEHPDVAQTLHNLALCVGLQKEWRASVPYLERALAIQEKALGPDHHETALTLSMLGGILSETGDHQRARGFLERALASQRKDSEREPSELAASMISLATVATRTGDTAGARALLDEALAIQREALGPEHHEVAYALTGLAAVEAIEGHLDRAKPLFEEAIRIAEQAFGPKHPDNANRKNQLASVLRGLGDSTGADSLDAQASAILRADSGGSAEP